MLLRYNSIIIFIFKFAAIKELANYLDNNDEQYEQYERVDTHFSLFLIYKK